MWRRNRTPSILTEHGTTTLEALPTSSRHLAVLVNHLELFVVVGLVVGTHSCARLGTRSCAPANLLTPKHDLDERWFFLVAQAIRSTCKLKCNVSTERPRQHANLMRKTRRLYALAKEWGTVVLCCVQNGSLSMSIFQRRPDTNRSRRYALHCEVKGCATDQQLPLEKRSRYF